MFFVKFSGDFTPRAPTPGELAAEQTERVAPTPGSVVKPRVLNESPVDSQIPRCIQRILPSEQMVALVSTYTSIIAKH